MMTQEERQYEEDQFRPINFELCDDCGCELTGEACEYGFCLDCFNKRFRD
jgi:hypothetical protein